MFTYIALYAKETRRFWKNNLPTLWNCQTAGCFDSPFVLVRSVKAASLENAFMAMQGEVWSPNGEAKGLIHGLGIHHTSMSVGDVFLCVENGKYFMVDSFDFIEIKKGERP